MYSRKKEPPVPFEEKLPLINAFRKRVMKNKKPQCFKDVFKNDLRDFIPLKTECSISLEDLVIPVRNPYCKKVECVYNLEALIQNNGDQICRDITDFKCRVCSTMGSFNQFYFDISTAHYLREARLHFPDFEDRILEESIQFGLNKKKGNTYCIQDGKELICLHSIAKNNNNNSNINNNSKLAQSAIKTEQKEQDEQGKKFTAEVENITEKVIGHIKQHAQKYQNSKIEEGIQVNINQFTQDFQQSLEDNIKIQQIANNNIASFYEDQYCFNFFYDQQKKQEFVFIFVPYQNKWYKTALTYNKNNNNQNYQKPEFASTCRHFDPKTNQHSIIIAGGQDPNNSKSFFNTVYQIPLFKENPDQIQPVSQLLPLPNMPQQKAMVNLLSFKGDIYVFGGFQQIPQQSENPIAVSSCEYFNLSTTQWSVLPQGLPKPSVLLNFIKFQEILYIIGGYDEIQDQQKQVQKFQNMNLFTFDFDSQSFKDYKNILPNMDHLQNEGVRHFKGRGMAFMKQQDESICVFGGRNLDEVKYANCNNKSQSSRQFYMSEFNIPSNIWHISDVYPIRGWDIMNHTQKIYFEHRYEVKDKDQTDFEPVYFRDRVYFSYNSNDQPRYIVYDEFAEKKLVQHVFNKDILQ